MTTVIATPYPALAWWLVCLCLVAVVAIPPKPSPMVARLLKALGIAVSLAALGELFIFIQCGWWICCLGILCA